MSWTHPKEESFSTGIVWSSRLVCPACNKSIKKGTKAVFIHFDKGRTTAKHPGCIGYQDLDDIDNDDDEYCAFGDIENGMIG
jgi:hypothetical protein